MSAVDDVRETAEGPVLLPDGTAAMVGPLDPTDLDAVQRLPEQLIEVPTRIDGAYAEALAGRHAQRPGR